MKYPTVEFRIADVCTDLDDAILYAGLVRSLVRTLGARGATVSRSARRRAAGRALACGPARAERAAVELLSRRARPGRVAVDDLMDELRPDLEQHGEDALIEQLLGRLRRTGNSAAGIAVFARPAASSTSPLGGRAHRAGVGRAAWYSSTQHFAPPPALWSSSVGTYSTRKPRSVIAAARAVRPGAINTVDPSLTRLSANSAASASVASSASG